MKTWARATKSRCVAVALRGRYWAKQSAGQWTFVAGALALLSLFLAILVAIRSLSLERSPNGGALGYWAAVAVMVGIVGGVAACAAAIAKGSTPEKLEIEGRISQLKGESFARKEADGIAAELKARRGEKRDRFALWRATAWALRARARFWGGKKAVWVGLAFGGAWLAAVCASCSALSRAFGLQASGEGRWLAVGVFLALSLAGGLASALAIRILRATAAAGSSSPEKRAIETQIAQRKELLAAQREADEISGALPARPLAAPGEKEEPSRKARRL